MEQYITDFINILYSSKGFVLETERGKLRLTA